MSEDFELTDLFRNLTVSTSDGAPVGVMRDELWMQTEDEDGGRVYTLDVGP